MKRRSKIILKLLFIILILNIGISLASAQHYKLIEPLPPFEKGSAPSFGNYCSNLVKIGIVLAGVLAVVMLIIAGIIYLTAGDNTQAISKAKKYITDTILGILIVLTSWLLLHTINPDLLRCDIPSLKKINVKTPPPEFKPSFRHESSVVKINKVPLLQEYFICNEEKGCDLKETSEENIKFCKKKFGFSFKNFDKNLAKIITGEDLPEIGIVKKDGKNTCVFTTFIKPIEKSGYDDNNKTYYDYIYHYSAKKDWQFLNKKKCERICDYLSEKQSGYTAFNSFYKKETTKNEVEEICRCTEQ